MNGWMVGCSIGLICFCACFLSSLHSIHSPFQISSWYPFVDLFLLQGIQSQWYCKAQSSVLSQRRSKQMTPAWLFTLPPLGLWIFNRLRCGQEKWLGCIYFTVVPWWDWPVVLPPRYPGFSLALFPSQVLQCSIHSVNLLSIAPSKIPSCLS